jgi:uncharacterized protein YaeQ
MAFKATIFKADLQIADMDRHYYASHALTIAQHPSETDERMMVRLMAFAHRAHEHLVFARGLSEADEPDLWQKDLTGDIEQWVDVGLPDERRIFKASGRARHVTVYAYGGRAAALWWAVTSPKLARLKNVTVFNLSPTVTQALTRLAQRNMKLGCTIEDGALWLNGESESVQVAMEVLQAEAG